jgi:hypothetical protein
VIEEYLPANKNKFLLLVSGSIYWVILRAAGKINQQKIQKKSILYFMFIQGVQHFFYFKTLVLVSFYIYIYSRATELESIALNTNGSIFLKGFADLFFLSRQLTQ